MTPILAFDIETVPDCAGMRRLYDLPEELPDAEVAEIAFQKRRAKTVAGQVAAEKTADDALMGARSKLAEGVDDLVEILRQPEMMEQIPEVNRANFAKHLQITKLKIENAIAIIRAGAPPRDEE